MIKKMIGFLVILVSMLTFPLFSNAASLEVKDYFPEDIDIIESTQYYPVPKSSEGDKVISFDVEGVDKKSGEIVDEEKFKESPLEFFNNDSKKYEEGIKNIDSIVEQSLYNQEIEKNLKNIWFESDADIITPSGAPA